MNCVMSMTYCLVDPRGKGVADADSVGCPKGQAADLYPGRYAVDEISTEPLASGRAARRWGAILERAYGTVLTEPDPWEA